MKQYKQIDAWGSAVLIVVALILLLTPWRNSVMALYFVVGAWQLVSAGVHWAKGWGTKQNRARYIYQWTIVAILLLILMGFLSGILLLWVMAGLLFLGPLLAIAYTGICFYELKRMTSTTATAEAK